MTGFLFHLLYVIAIAVIGIITIAAGGAEANKKYPEEIILPVGFTNIVLIAMFGGLPNYGNYIMGHIIVTLCYLYIAAQYYSINQKIPAIIIAILAIAFVPQVMHFQKSEWALIDIAYIFISLFFVFYTKKKYT